MFSKAVHSFTLLLTFFYFINVTFFFFAVYAPKLGVGRVFAVTTESMRPAIADGSMVFVKPAYDLVSGDVITFQRIGIDDIPITHRVLNIDGEYIETKGDANIAADEGAITYDEVIGRVSFSLPFIGWFLLFLHTEWGISVCLVIPTLLLMLFVTVKRGSAIMNALFHHKAVIGYSLGFSSFALFLLAVAYVYVAYGLPYVQGVESEVAANPIEELLNIARGFFSPKSLVSPLAEEPVTLSAI